MRIIKLPAVIFVLLIPFVLNACYGTRTRIQEAPLYGQGAPHAQQSELVPGQSFQAPPLPLEVNDTILAEGERLYNWYNCAGCHFNGGGGIGPPLMDDAWIYGSEPQNIADSIINGRPQGMPAYGGRIPAAHIAPVVAHVRSLSGLGVNKPTPTPIPAKEKQGEKQQEQTTVKEQQRQ